MLDPRSVALLGIGSAPHVAARFGLWDVVVPPSGDFFPSGRPQPGKQSRLRRQAKASVRLEIGFSISSSASLSIGATVAAGVSPEIESAAGLRLSASTEIHQPTTVAAEADVRDVILEMLLLAD